MKRKNILIGFLVIIFLAVLVLAADSYRLNDGSDVDIDEHSVCKNVNNSGGKDIFIPTKTSLEWSEFRSNYPSGIVLDDCPECLIAEDCDTIYPSCNSVMDCEGGNCCYDAPLDGTCPSFECGV